ncbi:DUF397 domain-containing protein [Streptomyces sp. NPDC008222]|uniref:DUF397 domain-containing protein n=1 Tax=Streptomyces sp. NPDC008222 TaxID=3364820 RepID=UPI0036E5BBB0
MIRKTSAGDTPELAWSKSSYSGGTDGESCVEIATAPDTVHVRDSKDITRPSLTFSPATWAAFVPYAGA